MAYRNKEGKIVLTPPDGYETPSAPPEKNMFAEPSPAKQFLVNFLSGGPIARVNVYREMDAHGFEWEDIKYAFFNEIKGREYMQKGEMMWRIYPE